VKSLLLSCGLTVESDIITNTFVCAHKQIGSTNIAPEPKDTRVLIGAGHDDAVIEGCLSALPSFQKLPGSSKFQELWTVSCADATFCEFHNLLIYISI
jgi:hypothetical protein